MMGHTLSGWNRAIERIKAIRTQYRDMGDTPTPVYDLVVERAEELREVDRAALDEFPPDPRTGRPRSEPQHFALNCAVIAVVRLEELHTEQPSPRRNMLVNAAVVFALQVAREVLALQPAAQKERVATR